LEELRDLSFYVLANMTLEATKNFTQLTVTLVFCGYNFFLDSV